MAYFGLLRVSLTSPPFILPRVFTTISEFNPNVPNVPVSCMSQDGVRDAQYHAIVRYDTVRMYVICAYLRGAHCTCISDCGKSPHFLGAFFWLGFVVLAASCRRSDHMSQPRDR